MLFVRAKWFWVIFFPLSCLWALISWSRRRIFSNLDGYRSSLRVICVGNIHSGGSGKTPLVKTIADHFRNKNVAVLSRGYGGKLSNKGARVDLGIENGANLYGDEPWMLAHLSSAPVFIDKIRLRGLKSIEKGFSNGVVILDDGFQHFSLYRDLNLICINADKRPEENFCLPLGELREPISALSASDAVILTPGLSENGIAVWMAWLKQNFSATPIFLAQYVIEGLFRGNKPFPLDLADPLFSFCGIASPDRFVSSVQSINTNSKHLRSFRDHHEYTEKDIETLLTMAGEDTSQIFVTTDKDWSKAAPFFENRDKTLVSLRIGYKMMDEFWSWLEERLG